MADIRFDVSDEEHEMENNKKELIHFYFYNGSITSKFDSSFLKLQ
jgi:hypothetical protein